MNNKFLIFCFVLSLSQSQSLDQIKQAKEYVKRTGMSESQVLEAAKRQGYSDKEIEKAIKKAKKTEKNIPDATLEPDKNISNDIDLGTSVGLNTNLVPKKEKLEILSDETLDIVEDEQLNFEKEEQVQQKKLSYFGYDIFDRDPALFQASSVGLVDSDYLIGPGDELIVMLWGETQFRQVLTVDREGFVFIPEIGQVFVNGLNYNLLESKLFKVLSQSYASLNPQGGKASTFLDVSLGNLRPLRIQVLGEVAQPGAYTIAPSATLFSSLYYFKGPNNLGSLRDIRLIRNDEEIASIDFYDYLLTGTKPNDKKLQLDDVIFIPKRKKTVSIEGEVNRPAIYELMPNEGLSDIISMAGGLKITAYLDRAQIDRIVPFQQRKDLGMDRMFTDIDLNQVLIVDNKFSLLEGDKIQIYSVLDLRQNAVELSGSITRPGIYDIGDSLRVSELISKADSLLGDAYLDRADIIRMKPDFTEKLIKIDLGKAIKKDKEHDLFLNGMDRVKVYSMTEMISKTFVSISGHVKTPGRYLLQEDMTLYDLIFKAGGYIDEEFKKLTYLKRAELVRNNSIGELKKIIPFDLEKVLNKEDIALVKLQPDDALRIYSLEEVEGQKRYVSVDGHVKKPGRYELYEENMKVYDLLFKAGGLDDKEFIKLTHLDRIDLFRFGANRSDKKIIKLDLRKIIADKNHPQNILLKPGDEINVYSKATFKSYPFVRIEGSIKNPGEYELKNNMTLKDLILQSGGFSNDNYRFRLEISRVDPNVLDEDTYSEIISFERDRSFLNITNNAKDSNLVSYKEFFLNPYDNIMVRPDPFFKLQRKVEISGGVYYPGEYSLARSNETIYDLVERAGGLVPRAFPEASQFFRNGKAININLKKILKKPKSSYNIDLISGDKLVVRLRPNMIEINGEVSAPGMYQFLPKNRISDYITLSGGLSLNAEEEDIWLVDPSGKSIRYHRWFSNPKVKDGSILVVGKKEETEPFDKTEFAKEMASIFGSVAQVISLIFIAVR